MPELPEVEIIKIFLAENIVGQSVKSIEVLNPKSFIGDFNLIVGKKVESVERRAKVLIINFQQDRDATLSMTMLIHLKMSGQIVWKRRSDKVVKRQSDFIGGHPTLDMFGELPNRSTRVIFELVTCDRLPVTSYLYFNDQRKFGWIKLRETRQEIRDTFFDKLGPEPLEKEFSWQMLKMSLLRRRKTPIKVALLDQQIIAGVGNIYACEACFLAGINPEKKIGELENKDYQKLHKGIIQSLIGGIQHGGSSKTHFANPEGKRGVFLEYAFVYGRENLPCKNCNTPIKKIKLGGRGTFFCESCQK